MTGSKAGKLPSVPKLGPAGRRLFREINAVYELSPGETAILRQACATADLISWLDDEMGGQLMTAEGSTGQPRPNPLLSSIADQRRVFDALLRSLNLPMPDETEGRRRSPQQAANAQARWRKDRGRLGQT
jgi:hypothetical protein